MPLDDIRTYQKYDKQQIAACNELLPEQVRLAWEDTRSVKIPASYKTATNVVVIGMGGSALGPHIIQSVFASELKKPLQVVRDYNVPGTVTSKTLVILASFSGTTEEVVMAAREVQKRTKKIMVVTTGGKLQALAKRLKLPAYMFEPADLAKQPRLGVGFMVVGILGLLQRAGMLKVTAKSISQMRTAMNEVIDSCATDVNGEQNPAKSVAYAMDKRAVIIVAAEHLVGNAHVLQNQINETGKQFAIFREIPELNHHMMEGLTYPKRLFEKFTVLMLRSSLYHKRNQKRFDITADIFEKIGGEVVEYNCGGKTRLDEAGEVLQFGAFVSCYLSMLNKVDPYRIDFVDDFKRKMAK